MASDKAVENGLAKMREPFAANHISKLPKPTKAQTEAVRADYKKGIRCKECGSWHHPEVIHLDYVGHAALTDRLLDADPFWFWEPVAFNEQGLPAFDNTGGLWIKLTICGVTRLGYGHAANKPNADPGSREKEVIGDALRNAGMRFGAALDLWHKGDLHADDAADTSTNQPEDRRDVREIPSKGPYITDDQRAEIMDLATAKGITAQMICNQGGFPSIVEMPARQFRGCRKWIIEHPDGNQEIRPRDVMWHKDDILDDEVPY